MNADRDAPVFSEGQIDVTATPEELWDIMADFENWPSWNPDVQSVTLQGPIAEGTTFKWKAGITRLVSTLRVVDRPHALGWTGRTMGIRAIHVWRFAPTSEGAVARMEESFDGTVATLFRKRLQRQLDETTAKGLQQLKTAAEQRKTGKSTGNILSEASGRLVGPPVFKTGVRAMSSQAGSIPVRLRHQ